MTLKTKVKPINELVRRRLKQLRLGRKMSLKDVADRAGIPLGSYACLENGFYNISLDNLFRILGVLELEIGDVWPMEAIGCDATEQSLYMRRMQEFRLIEVIRLSSADGGALFKLEGGKAGVVLQHGLSDYLVDRLHFYLQDDISYDQGMWFSRKEGDYSLHFFLQARECPAYISRLVEDYMTIWSAAFGPY